MRLLKVTAHTVGGTAGDITVNSIALFENNHASQLIYLKPKDADAVTASTGWQLKAGERTSIPMHCGVLSVIASGADTDLRILYLG